MPFVGHVKRPPNSSPLYRGGEGAWKDANTPNSSPVARCPPFVSFPDRVSRRLGFRSAASETTTPTLPPRLRRGCTRVLPAVLRLVQRRAPPLSAGIARQRPCITDRPRRFASNSSTFSPGIRTRRAQCTCRSSPIPGHSRNNGGLRRLWLSRHVGGDRARAQCVVDTPAPSGSRARAGVAPGRSRTAMAGAA
jgi:hypothetical protein